MLDLSTEFKNEIFSDNRKFLAYMDIILSDGTVLNLENSDIWQNSISIEDATSSSGSFTIGAAVTGKLKVTLNNMYDDFSEYDFSKATAIAYAGLQLSETLEKVRLGTYVVDEPSYDGATISFSCLDNMTKFDKPYSQSTLAYPATLEIIVVDACTCCGVSLLSTDFQNKNYVVQNRPTDDALTFGDVLAMVAQLACCWAKMDSFGRLKLDWYQMHVFEENSRLDGGSFSTDTIPYSDGSTADGGNFTDYVSGDLLNGGTFDDQKKYHHLFSTKSFSVSTDDVVITGVRVTEEFEESETEKKGTYLAGTDDYVVEISGNALIQQGQAQAVAEYLYSQVGGMQFRPLEVEILANPAIEAGDIAYVTDRKGNTYQTFISTRTFTIGGSCKIICDAESPLKNSQTRYSEMTKTIVRARNETQRQLTVYDLAVQQLTNLMTQSFGLYKSEEVLEDGSVIFYMHNKPELATSSTIWKMTADALAVSTDGGQTWNAGVDSNGNAVYQILTAIGINADWINAGTITGREINNGNGTFIVDSLGKMKANSADIVGALKSGNGIFAVDSSGNCTANSFSSTDANISGGKINISTSSTIDGSKLKIQYSQNFTSISPSRVITSTDGTYAAALMGDSVNLGEIADLGNSNYSMISFTYMNRKELVVAGTKSRVVDTPNYARRLLYCYETPSPMFGDIGEGIIDETGKCYIYIDDVFAETIDTDCQYQVFLQSYGDGNIYVSERTSSYFVVYGTPDMRFAWEVKAVQRDYDTMRLEESNKNLSNVEEDAAADSYYYLMSLLYDVESEDLE